MTSVYNHAIIPVADAELGSACVTGYEDNSKAALTPKLSRKVAFSSLSVWTLIHCANYGYIAEVGSFVNLLAIARYFLWPAIFLLVSLHLVKEGAGRFLSVAALIVPFFIIGVVSGLLGYQPIESARLVVFWLFGIAAAIAIGEELNNVLLQRVLFFLFFAMIASSIAFIFLKPEWGLSIDNRAGSGKAWRGLFPGKNLLGLIATYALAFSLLGPRIKLIVRLASVAAAIATLAFAHSQGSILAAAAVVGYIVATLALRQLPISNPARILLLAFAILTVIVLIAFVFPLLLELLGRDATLTGRASIWSQWLARAMLQWPIGYGPGSFTQLSFVTVDLAASDAGLGTIHTPHNMFIAVFGETGVFGLIAFVSPLLYFALVVPFTHITRAGLLAGTVAMTMLVGGISETREVFGLGMNMFLVIATYANARRGQKHVDDPGTPDRIESDRNDPSVGTMLALGT